jgi:hypothetical protein
VARNTPLIDENGVRRTRSGELDKRCTAEHAERMRQRLKAGPRGPTKRTISIRALIEGALDDLGGQAWLVKQANRYPQKFMELVARVMPLQVQTEHHEFQYVIQKISADSAPVPGVIRDGLEVLERLQ